MKPALIALTALCVSFSQPALADNTKHASCKWNANLVASLQLERQDAGNLDEARQRVINDAEIPLEFKAAFLSLIRVTLAFPIDMSHNEAEVETYRICMAPTK